MSNKSIDWKDEPIFPSNLKDIPDDLKLALQNNLALLIHMQAAENTSEWIKQNENPIKIS